MSAILDYFRYVGEQLKSIRAVDVLDILLVAFVFYYIFQFMRKRRAGKLLVGVVLLIVLLLISEVAKMKALNFILTNVFSVGILSLIVVFQPELRSFLEKVGGTTFHNFKGKLDKNQDAALRSVVNEVCIAADYFSKTRTGALIVFERETKLGDQAKTGTVVNADVSSYLLENIFFNKSPLHDGAVIISDGRLHAAGCLLPLSANENLIRELGTRHRAGIGMSENSDAVVLIVSEETGIISVAVEGELKRGFD
ncbi:MAG: diadenylate cyclase CdaA, partial [Clostridia bacterium]|nr:diadenylate cyclase CdaA [Clostridia bacterium]